jgi:hypothetical protein
MSDSNSTPSSKFFHNEDGSKNTLHIIVAIFGALSLIAIIIWLVRNYMGQTSSSTSSSAAAALTSKSATIPILGKMGQKVYVEQDQAIYINLSELSGSLGGVKHRVVDGGINTIFMDWGWQKLVDGNPATCAATDGSANAKIWIDFGSDVMVDQITILNRTDLVTPICGQLCKDRIKGLRVVLRKADGSTTWQTTINDVKDEYQFDLK